MEALPMKVSKARLEKALQLRDAAVRILTRIGYDAIIADSERGYCHRTIQAKINDLTAARRIKPTSPHCRSARQPNPGRRSTYRRGDSVQTTGTSSLVECRAPDGPC